MGGEDNTDCGCAVLHGLCFSGEPAEDVRIAVFEKISLVMLRPRKIVALQVSPEYFFGLIDTRQIEASHRWHYLKLFSPIYFN